MDNLKKKFKGIYIFGRYPDRDWFRMLVFFTLLFVALVTWTVFFTLSNNSSYQSVTNVLQSIPTQGRTKGDELRDLVEVYEKKATTYAQLFASSSVASVDPSR